jgi:hypothetical protein
MRYWFLALFFTLRVDSIFNLLKSIERKMSTSSGVKESVLISMQPSRLLKDPSGAGPDKGTAPAPAVVQPVGSDRRVVQPVGSDRSRQPLSQ